MTNARFSLFLTTAIPYVNASPHVGHALELLIGDALARHARQRGHDVRLTGGTDDHSIKNARAAEARGISTAALVREHGDTFRRLPTALGVELDDYLHTSRDPRHVPCVRELWRRCLAAGDLYEREYRGLYCTGCEAFVDEAELVSGLCVSHGVAPDAVAERNWFFRLSRYEAPLLAALESGALRVEPRERHAEVVSFVRGGLADFSVSRSRARARDWGIPVPNDPSQVIYVWFDALASYLSLLGFPTAHEEQERFWAGAGAREHLIGKDVLRFHAVYWPALLLSAGLPLPTAIKTHGFVTSHGVKIAKSLGNVVDPFSLVSRYGLAAVRYYFLRHLHTTKDSDFDESKLVEAHDAELAGKLGNLLERVAALASRHPTLTLGAHAEESSDADRALDAAERSAVEAVTRGFDELALHRALGAVLELVAAANRYTDEQAPWLLSRRALDSGAPGALRRLAHVLFHVCEALRVTALLIAPFLPDASRELLARLGLSAGESEARVGEEPRLPRAFSPRPGPPLFPRLRAPQRTAARTLG